MKLIIEMEPDFHVKVVSYGPIPIALGIAMVEAARELFRVRQQAYIAEQDAKDREIKAAALTAHQESPSATSSPKGENEC